MKSLLDNYGTETVEEDFNKMIEEKEKFKLKPNELTFKMHLETFDHLRNQLININQHLLDGLEVFYSFVDDLFSRFQDDMDTNPNQDDTDPDCDPDFDPDCDGSGDESDKIPDSKEEEEKNRELLRDNDVANDLIFSRSISVKIINFRFLVLVKNIRQKE